MLSNFSKSFDESPSILHPVNGKCSIVSPNLPKRNFSIELFDICQKKHSVKICICKHSFQKSP